MKPYEWYDIHHKQFAERADSLDMNDIYTKFLRSIPKGSWILDAGCGSGRDALAFAQLGYKVLALDASEEMIRLTKEKCRSYTVVTCHCTFEDVPSNLHMSGIWTCASLLHVPPKEFLSVCEKLIKPQTLYSPWYMCFKYGEGERIDKDGRYFVDHTPESLEEQLNNLKLYHKDIWITEDARAQKWVNALVIV